VAEIQSFTSAGRTIQQGGSYQKWVDATWHNLGRSVWSASTDTSVCLVINPLGQIYMNSNFGGCKYDASNAGYDVWTTYTK
jgi:hypothetical protein